MKSYYILLMLLLAGCSEDILDNPKELARIKYSTVMLSGSGKQGMGVLVAPDVVLTAAHVASSLEKGGTATLPDGREAPASVLWIAKDKDIALIAAHLDAPALPLRCDLPAVGESVVSIGSPSTTEFITVWGHVASGMNPNPGSKSPLTKSTIAIDMSVGAGQSGSPIFDRKGRLVGIMYASVVSKVSMPLIGDYFSVMGIGLATPGSSFCEDIGLAS